MGWWKETIAIVKENDPAARSLLEVLLTYPGIKALAAHRISHFLWNHGCKLLARMHSQFWRFWTQIEIHPGAKIASGVFIDHGSGLVIGETAVVEKGVVLLLEELAKMLGNVTQRFAKAHSFPLMRSSLVRLKLVKMPG